LGAPPHNLHWSSVRLFCASGQPVSSTPLPHRATPRYRHPPPLPITAHHHSHAQPRRFPDPSHSVRYHTEWIYGSSAASRTRITLCIDHGSARRASTTVGYARRPTTSITWTIPLNVVDDACDLLMCVLQLAHNPLLCVQVMTWSIARCFLRVKVSFCVNV